MLSVFVYGTLKPGQANHCCCRDYVLSSEAAMVSGMLFDLPAGYPAMTLGDLWVKGVRLTFADDRVLAVLDQLEDYSPRRSEAENEYQRAWIEMFSPAMQSLGYGWTYLMGLDRVQRWGGRLVPSGVWPEA
jgi:gamma-glutamylcyclotransferase (GGCT)/AIG2-like uncharacterized protein YtfP